MNPNKALVVSQYSVENITFLYTDMFRILYISLLKNPHQISDTEKPR